ncbi:MAG TPA: hypothetical protein DHV65_15165, partial [Ktedonobacter sp.]|nr:hypothetical protein [Ktedonobacter sp.]
DLGIRKPNPAIFLHTLNALDIPPTEAVMVGDSLSADIAGGKGLGLYTIWKPNPDVQRQAQLIATGATVAANSTLALSECLKGNRSDDLPRGL